MTAILKQGVFTNIKRKKMYVTVLSVDATLSCAVSSTVYRFYIMLEVYNTRGKCLLPSI